MNLNHSYQRYITVSFDVVSLFTNVSVDLVIKVIEKKWHDICLLTPIDKKTFIKMIRFCLTDCNYFQYNGKTYKQLYGTAMGNPLSAVASNIVLDNLLEVKLKELEF